MANYNIKKLRKDLMDYFGTAMHSGFPMAVIDLGDIENMSDEQLLEFASRNGVDIEKYNEEYER